MRTTAHRWSGSTTAEGRGPAPRHLRWRRVVAWGGLVLLVGSAGAGLTYRRQIASMLTHRKGPPTSTWPVAPFATPPDARIAAVGDVGEGEEEEWRTANAIDVLAEERPYDALLLLGDNVYPAGDPERLDQTVFQPFGMVLRDGTELLAILGNHDVVGGNGPEQMTRLGMPGAWWTVAIGDVRIVGLDSNRPDDPEQLAFLERTLASATETWKIVAVHEPPYSSGYQGSNFQIRGSMVPLFRRYGVQLVLSGPRARLPADRGDRWGDLRRHGRGWADPGNRRGALHRGVVVGPVVRGHQRVPRPTAPAGDHPGAVGLRRGRHPRDVRFAAAVGSGWRT